MHLGLVINTGRTVAETGGHILGLRALLRGGEHQGLGNTQPRNLIGQTVETADPEHNPAGQRLISEFTHDNHLSVNTSASLRAGDLTFRHCIAQPPGYPKTHARKAHKGVRNANRSEHVRAGDIPWMRPKIM